MSEVILYSGWYSPALCRRYPELVFVFGDNLHRFGRGGQAIIRAEPNVLGVATKRRPSMNEHAFFREDAPEDLDAVLRDLKKVWDRLDEGTSVVIPLTQQGEISLGRERAELLERAPTIYKTIVLHVNEMSAAFGSREASDADGL